MHIHLFHTSIIITSEKMAKHGIKMLILSLATKTSLSIVVNATTLIIMPIMIIIIATAHDSTLHY